MIQKWDPKSYAKDAAFVSIYGEELITLLAPIPGDKVMDLGCGDGFLTEKMAEIGCVVTGVDASAAQVGATKERGIKAVVPIATAETVIINLSFILFLSVK